MPYRTEALTPLLSGMALDLLAELRPFIQVLSFRQQEIIRRAGDTYSDLYFIDAGLVSLIAERPKNVGVALLGCGDLIGVSAILGAAEAPSTAIATVEGKAWRVPREAFDQIAARDFRLRLHFDRYIGERFRAASHAIAVATACTVEQRLAAWLSTAFQRQDTDVLPLTHEILAMTIGCRRPGITVAMHILEGEHAIVSRRKAIEVRDPSRLRELAGFALQPTLYAKPAHRSEADQSIIPTAESGREMMIPEASVAKR